MVTTIRKSKVALDPDWQSRERERLTNGHYKPVPWDLEPIPDHFLHISREAPSMVAFTENAAKGAKDIHMRMRPGKYLTKFYPHLKAETVRTLACQIDVLTVQFATTPDDIQRVYEKGPDSCMKGSSTVRAYGAGDLAVAYLSDLPLEHRSFHPTARTVVWPEKKLYCRTVYGDRERLIRALEELRFKDGDMRGARLLGTGELPSLECTYEGYRYDPKTGFRILR